MRFLEHTITAQPGQSPGDNEEASTNKLQMARSEADRLLAAGDDAIQRALSGSDSEAFLRASRQQGGE
jgi:hypothetical protein